jgi:hypothetical protein
MVYPEAGLDILRRGRHDGAVDVAATRLEEREGEAENELSISSLVGDPDFITVSVLIWSGIHFSACIW